MSTADIPYIVARWERTLWRVNSSNGSEAAHAISEICLRYTEPHRFYHNLSHLKDCFWVLDDLGVTDGAIELALWYHDIVYDVHAKGSEEASAILAEQRIIGLGLGSALAKEVADLIRATSHDTDPEGHKAKVLLDVDTSILSAAEGQFDQYEKNIRSEYEWVPEEQFKAGRTKILEMFLSRPWIYHTEAFRGSREGQARLNLARSLLKLKT